MSTSTQTPGLHHVTCIAGDPQRNLDFWIETLGLRLVKRSINQDDPTTYHFFFGDARGTPGTSMTFFPWEDMAQGTVGSGQVSRVAFRVPDGSLSHWEKRFDDHGVAYDDRIDRFGESVLPVRDPDGLPVELVAVDLPADEPTVPWTEFVGEGMAIRGFHSVTLSLADPDPTVDLLQSMGFDEMGDEIEKVKASGDGRRRFAADGPVGKYVDVVSTTDTGRQGRGTVHHVAFQTPTDDDQEALRRVAQSRGLQPTAQIDRHWFRSVYFRESNGVLFELATNGPGYTSDEELERLGERLVLPGSFENRREEIQGALPNITLPRPERTESDD